MSRIQLSVALAALVVSSAGAQTKSSDDTPTFRSATELVRVSVTVANEVGRLITNLSEVDFEVRDNGRRQRIALFDNRPQPVGLVLLLDVSGSMEGKLALLRGAAEQLLLQLKPQDTVRIGTFGSYIAVSQAYPPVAPELRAALPAFAPPHGRTPLWRAVNEAMDALSEEPDDRRLVVIVMSDGKDNGSSGVPHRYVTRHEVMNRAVHDNVMVYGVGVRSAADSKSPDDDDSPDPGLSRLAEETGGGYAEIARGDDLGAVVAQIANELRGQYLIAFAPTKLDGKLHEIEVRVLRQGATARARKSYFAAR